MVIVLRIKREGPSIVDTISQWLNFSQGASGYNHNNELTSLINSTSQ